MSLQTSLLRQLENPRLSRNQRAMLCCQLGKEYEDTGQLEAARQAMGEFWQRIGERPQLEGLDQSAAAEVLLRAGSLTSCIGNKNQVTNAQETAKNLISQSISIFESLNDKKKVAEAQTDLARCYFKEGRYDEARVIL
nr:tetratricopeptide repeat protein [Acidobacteriota bacterium]